MRALVGAACVAVIAFVGYYFWGEFAPQPQTVAAVASEPRVSQYRLNLTEDQALDKIAGVDFNPYSQSRNPEIFEALNRETITGELQRLRVFAAKDAARFLSCQRVESVHYSPQHSTRMDLAVDVLCSGGLGVTYTRNGPITDLQPV